jgi:hypothetical protein
MEYQIDFAGSAEGTLYRLGMMRSYATLADVIAAVGPVMSIEPSEAASIAITDEEYGGPQWLVYPSRRAMDMDDDGSRAVLIVSRRKVSR